MRPINAFRQALAQVPDVTPVVTRLATSDVGWTIPAGDMRRALGGLEYEGAWCFPVGAPGETAYPPLSERQVAQRWSRVNWLGARYSLRGTMQVHTGDDLDLPGAADIGEPVRAPCDGQVTYARLVPGSTWGNVLVMRMVWGENEWAYTRFGHLNAILVREGEAVRAGQVVAYVGNVGMPEAPHLHWDVMKPGDDVLTRQPLHWPGADAAAVQAHYVDPGAFVRDRLVPPAPRPEPSGAWHVTMVNLNARREPKIAPDNILTVLPLGTRVRLSDEKRTGSNLTWRQVTDSPHAAAVSAWVAEQHVRLEAVTPPKPPDSKPPTVASLRRTGLHTIGALSGAAIQMLKDCHAAGRPVAVATIVLSGQAAQLVKQLSPQTVTIVRPVWPDEYPTENGRVKFSQAWFNAYLDPVRPWLPYIDYVKFLNEKWPGNGVSGQALEDVRDFYMALVRACRAVGIRCTILDLAAGNMSDARFRGEPDQFAVMKPLLELAAREGCPLNYHCYNPLIPAHVYDPTHDPETWVLRPVYWMERVPGLKCVGCESLVPEWKDLSGQDARLPGDSARVVENARQVDELWAGVIRAGRIRDEQWVGHGPFTDVPGQRWEGYNMEPHQAALARYLIGG